MIAINIWIMGILPVWLITLAMIKSGITKVKEINKEDKTALIHSPSICGILYFTGTLYSFIWPVSLFVIIFLSLFDKAPEESKTS